MLDYSKLTKVEEEIFTCSRCKDLLASRMYPMPGFIGNKEIKLMVRKI